MGKCIFNENWLQKDRYKHWLRRDSNNHKARCMFTSIKYKVERDERYLPYIELGRWLCSHFQLETPLNFHKPITKKLYNVEQ